MRDLHPAVMPSLTPALTPTLSVSMTVSMTVSVSVTVPVSVTDSPPHPCAPASMTVAVIPPAREREPRILRIEWIRKGKGLAIVV